MDIKTLTALQGSIQKWEEIVGGGGKDRGTVNCPLCQEFYDNPGCDGCPVAAAVNDSLCDGTPYVQWSQRAKFHQEFPDSYRTDRPESHEYAVAELEFLKSLLPKEPTV